MGEKQYFQPLTKKDKISVIIYRAGILLSAILLVGATMLFLMRDSLFRNDPSFVKILSDILIISLYFSAGLSVFFIHLYIGRFHRALKKVYYLSAVCLAILYILGKGHPASLIAEQLESAAFLLIPLSLCLGFITAKEAFCFRLLEGYVIALLMPASLFLFGAGVLNSRNALALLSLNSALFVIFTFRKIFMPLHYDVGDKSAYQP